MQTASRSASRGYRFHPVFLVRIGVAAVPPDSRTLVLNRAGALIQWCLCHGCPGTKGGALPAACPLAPHHESMQGCVPCPLEIDLLGEVIHMDGTIRAVERHDGEEDVWITFRTREGEPARCLDEALRRHLFASNLLLYEPSRAEAERLCLLWEGIGIPPEREESWFGVIRRLKTENHLGVIADLDAFGTLDMGFTLAKSMFPATRIIAISSDESIRAARSSPVAAEIDSFLSKPVTREALIAALGRSAGWTGF